MTPARRTCAARPVADRTAGTALAAGVHALHACAQLSRHRRAGRRVHRRTGRALLL